MSKEEDLYESVRKSLQRKFNEKGECYLEVTAQGVTNEIKKILDDDSVYIFEAEKKRPDLMGYVVVSYVNYESTHRIIVEVKNKALVFSDIYQIKMYAEMFDAKYAFLISTEGFNEVRRRFLRKRSLLGFWAYNNIIIMRYINGYLERDKDLSPFDPFDPLT